MIQHSHSYPDFISGFISLGAIVLAFFGHLTPTLQDSAYIISITAGLSAIVFGFLNYRLNKKKTDAELGKRKFSKKSRK